jgi:hypothetical protein
MPGTYAVDLPATFSAIMLVNVTPKQKFGGQPGQQETNAAGVPQWVVDAAATFIPTFEGMRAASEMISFTVASPVHPAQNLVPGTAIVVDGFRVGLNPPEQRADGKGIKGGKLWCTAAGLRPLVPASGRRENAA